LLVLLLFIIIIYFLSSAHSSLLLLIDREALRDAYEGKEEALREEAFREGLDYEPRTDEDYQVEEDLSMAIDMRTGDEIMGGWATPRKPRVKGQKLSPQQQREESDRGTFLSFLGGALASCAYV